MDNMFVIMHHDIIVILFAYRSKTYFCSVIVWFLSANTFITRTSIVMYMKQNHLQMEFLMEITSRELLLGYYNYWYKPSYVLADTV